METKENIRYWGYHFMLSATGLDKAKVKDQEYIKDFFKDVVFAIDMVAMMEPETRYCETNDEDKRGVTAFVIIETSNLCAHFLDEGAVLFDVFSCLDFDRKIPERLLKSWFNGEGTRVRITDRQFIKRKL
jgi:S-adenosylmethionine/arginine decarboxylase-like enzyme